MKPTISTLILCMTLLITGCGTQKQKHTDPKVGEEPQASCAPCEAVNDHTQRCVFFGSAVWIFQLSNGSVCSCSEGNCSSCEEKEEKCHDHH